MCALKADAALSQSLVLNVNHNHGRSCSCPQCLPSTSSTLVATRSATKKAGGSASQKKASKPKNLGVKMFGGELIFPGQIIVRQRGTKFHPGQGVGLGRDHTIYAKSVGFVSFNEETVTFKNGKVKDRMFISIKPIPVVEDRALQGTSSAHEVPCIANKEDDYKEMQQVMIARRAIIKRSMHSNKAFEPALFFPLKTRENRVSLP
ncbi:hypothetical protein CEUSTIGMA_g8459.t1 [Chlamydomonas eustigma]|uniref:Ribosomal protein L27 n=1 Tax=Chlamydomonas eustigma TaxID=1157962 RepID=A0A250XD66_9CHLO|nr:hypothetical protein CEUSTIGMA_g8459.t1 [Chlamydomonas eustigma]|eukprot:GAX81024.1 hypothetical protein CEUSTIGMA_g8459.t1 [Chlamydomonas eustigma]